MPRYHYLCKECETNFEEVLPFGTEKSPPCPTCGTSIKVQKLMKMPMVQFKGTGFYKTDSTNSVTTSTKKSDEIIAEKKSDTKEASTTPAEKATSPKPKNEMSSSEPKT